MEHKTYYHHGTLLGDGTRFTIAGHYEETYIVMGISICSNKDQFRKDLGRQKAEGRSLAKEGTPGNILFYFEESLSSFKGKEAITFVEKVKQLIETAIVKNDLLELFNLTAKYEKEWKKQQNRQLQTH